jgi:hypothetical protein
VQTPSPETLFNPVSVDRPDRFDLTLWNLPDVRNNLLAFWSPKSYRARSLSFKLLNQSYFVCNSPDTVRRVFLDRHDNYDKKSPQMRHALEPLLAFRLTFLNKCDEAERPILAEYYQRCFGDELPESSAHITLS